MGLPEDSWELPGRDCRILGDRHHRSPGPGCKVDMGDPRAVGVEHLGEADRWEDQVVGRRRHWSFRPSYRTRSQWHLASIWRTVEVREGS